MRNYSAVVGMFLSLVCGHAVAADIDAKVAWSQRVELGTAVSGTIAEVNARIGQRVSQGDALLQLDATRFKAAVKQTRARLKQKKYALDEANREWQRAQELYERTVLSDRDKQLAENAYIAALAEHAQAAAAKINAAEDLQDSVIHAPFDAVVLERSAEPGQVVISRLQATPLLIIAATGSYLAQAALRPGDLNGLQPGQAADVSIGGERYKGEIHSIGLEADTQGKYLIQVRFTTGDSVIRSGQQAILHLP